MSENESMIDRLLSVRGEIVNTGHVSGIPYMEAVVMDEQYGISASNLYLESLCIAQPYRDRDGVVTLVEACSFTGEGVDVVDRIKKLRFGSGILKSFATSESMIDFYNFSQQAQSKGLDPSLARVDFAAFNYIPLGLLETTVQVGTDGRSLRRAKLYTPRFVRPDIVLQDIQQRLGRGDA